MEKTNKSSNLRIIFSTIALVSFVLFSLCDNLVVREFNTYHTYGWRLGILNDLFLSISFIGLLVFSIMERKMRHINGRSFVASIFIIYLVQTLLLWFMDGATGFSIFCCNFLGKATELVTIILIVRIIALLLIPIAHKNMLRFYSLGMIALFGFAMIAILTSDYFHMRNSIVEIIVSLGVDILFHIALFFFSDLLDKNNESVSWLALLGGLMYPIFGEMFDEDDDNINYTDPAVYGEKRTYCVKGETLMNKHSEIFSDEALKSIDVFDIDGENFLLDSPEGALLHIDLERQEEKITVSGYFKHTFTEEQAARILKKRSILNKTFQDISLDALVDASIGVESIEEGELTISLATRTFSSKDPYEIIRTHILRFMELIIVIHNVESYE